MAGAGKPSGWSAWRAKGGGATKFTGIVGRESSKSIGKQGMHHHPLMGQLGNALKGGMKPGGFTGGKF